MFKRLFPTLAEWPPEKLWFGLPLALMFFVGCIGGLWDLYVRGLW